MEDKNKDCAVIIHSLKEVREYMDKVPKDKEFIIRITIEQEDMKNGR